VGRWFIRRSMNVTVGHSFDSIVFKDLTLRWDGFSCNFLLLARWRHTNLGNSVAVCRTGRCIFSLLFSWSLLLATDLFFTCFRSCFHHHMFFLILLTNGFVEVLGNFYFSDVSCTVLFSEFLDSLQVMSHFGCLFDDSIVCLWTIATCDASLLTAATWNLIL
jgi:hypothetical protein